MSAPTPAPGDDRPREGYYPDPSIPGYVRYWNGASWVPGTSRPAPTDGEPLTTPPGSGQAWPPNAPAAQAPGAGAWPDPAGTGTARTPHASGPAGAHGWTAPAQGQGTPSAPGQAPAPGQGQAPQAAVSHQPLPGAQPSPGHQPLPGAHPSPGHQPLPGAQPPPGQQPFPAQQSGPARQPVAGPVHAHGGAAGQGAGAPSGAAPGGSFGPAPGAPSVEATGPHFFDEDPDAGRPPSPEDAQHGSRPEPASAWGADRSRQAGYGGDPDHRVSWGSPPGADPRLPAEPQAAQAAPPAVPADGAKPDGTFVFRRPVAGTSEPAAPAAPVADEGTMTFRPVRTGRNDAPSGPGFGAGKAAAERAAAAQAQPVPSPAAPAQPEPPRPAPVPAPMAGGQGGGQPSWAQQVHRLAGDDGDQPVVPWKPPVEDVFQATAWRRAEARPAPLGKRLAARLLDTVVVAAVTGAAAVPLGTRAVDHVDEKIDAAKLSGETVTVWLLDGTTAVYLGIVLAVLLLFGVVYEALPTARWGRTAGKRLFGLDVRDIEGHEPPGFGAALRRWLVYSVPGLLVFGVIGVLWCLFDRPWHQCWHDKAAHTFVAG